MQKYLIDDQVYKCSKKVALDIAYTRGIKHVFIIGKSNHYVFDGGKWCLAFGGNHCNDPHEPASQNANKISF